MVFEILISGVYTEPYQHHNGHSISYSKKKSYVLSALTLLAFLFFLHILEHSLKEQINGNDPVVIFLSAPEYFDVRFNNNLTSLKKKRKIARNKMQKVFLKSPSEYFKDEIDDENNSYEDLNAEPIGEEYIDSEYKEI